MKPAKIEFAEGFVLAGGSSTRMGRDKSTVIFGGETLLARASAALASVFVRNSVILNPRQSAPLIDLPVLRDRFIGRGASAGIDAGLSHSRAEWSFFLAVDLPFVNAEIIRFIADRASDEFDAVVPRQSDGRLQPLAALYRTQAFREPVAEMLARGDSPSIRDIIRGARVLEIGSREFDDSDAVFHNVNKPEDIR